MSLRINYVSNLPLTSINGGGSGVNSYTFQELSKGFKLNYVGPVSPPVDKVAKLKSVSKRILLGQGNYHFFSEKRLKQSAAQVLMHSHNETDAFFFHGITPWIKLRITKPYFIYSDACFATYVEVFNNRMKFEEKDLRRIFNQEADFLENASCVFFRSRWAMEETKRHYNLSGKNFMFVGFGGGVPVPEHDTYKGSLKVLFISKEFEAKGGYECLEGFTDFQKKFPSAELFIIGDRPRSPLNLNGVHCCGFIDKSNKEGMMKFVEYLKDAFALVHPTRKDTNTLVITEAGYYGVPSIASASFAIPDFVMSGKTGYLLDTPVVPQQITNYLVSMAENKVSYNELRKNVREHFVHSNTWPLVGEKMTTRIHSACR